MMPFFLQYMFMFQVPKLPECVMGLRDYSSIKDSFTGQFGVSWTTVVFVFMYIIYTLCSV